MKRLYLLIPIFSFLFSFSAVQAQKDTSLVNQQVMIKMFDGERYHGLLISKEDSMTVIDSKNGEFTLKSANIKRIKKYPFGEKYWYSNPHTTHYFIAPSAIPIEKEKVYYNNYLLTINSFQVGLSKNISIGTSFETIFLLDFHTNLLWSLNTKIGFHPTEMLHIGGGLVWVRSLSLTTYLAATLGAKESNVTLGVNYNFMDGDFIGEKGFTCTLSGVHRFNNKLSLMMENTLYYNGYQPASVGIYGVQLHFKRNNFRLAYSFSNPDNGITDYRLFPVVGFARVL